MSDDSADLSAFAAAIAPLVARIDQLFAEQQEHVQLFAQANVRLDQLAQQVADLQQQALWHDSWVKETERSATATHDTATQVVAQMQWEITSLNKQLLDVTASLNHLHSIGDSTLQEQEQLRYEITMLQDRLTRLESAGPSH